MNEKYLELSKGQSKQVCRNMGNLCQSLSITHSQLAELTGYKRSSITRIFSGRFAPHMDIVFCLLNAMNELSGKTLTLKDIDVSEPQTPE